ncbi:hypothetical protein [Aquisalibacillus elongatus]|uniref:Acetyltransferase (GNAT) family protein n=1 Tax=Aquisalibacillus elongatus TaxID=485577 RepID=A0A3N5C700_9BACI|nr:hypothetical protein [Aquisalibacillus elongatus]RPF54095.1 hypothetical protein EDC24_1283 [Aquisalibacillus elongatus]
MITITPVKEQTKEDYDSFFKQEQDKEKLFNETWVQEHGYFLELDGQQLGFFVLYPINDKKVWLRRLVMSEQTNPALLIMVFDWISEKAKAQKFKELYVHVQDSSTSPLLEMNRFNETYEPPVHDPKDVDWFMKEL